MNENASYIFDVEEPRAWVFTGEPVWISGWFLSKTGAVFSDIRAIIDGVPHLGIFGLPREAIERAHRGYAGLPHAGFSLLVRPPLGAKLIRLELLDAGRHWVEIWRTPIEVRQGPKAGAWLNAGVVPDQLRKLLQACRADPAADFDPLAHTLALESSVVPLETLPNPPFFGALENPLLTGGSQFGKLKVEGWIIHQQQRIRRLIGSTHPHVENEMDYGDRERAEAGQLFPGHPYAARSQFFGMVDIDEAAGDPVGLKIFAELEDGTRHLVFMRRCYQRGCTQMERPLPEFSRATFLRVALALAGGCRSAGVHLGRIGDFWRECQHAYRLYRLFAPTSLEHLTAAGEDPYLAWQRANFLSAPLRQLLDTAAQRLGPAGPRLVLLVDTRDCTPTQLRELANSLRAQIYPHWQAWFVGPLPAPRGDDRLRTEPGAGPEAFIRGLNAVARRAEGAYLSLIPGHSRLPPDALIEIAGCLAPQPALELIYTDEDRMDDTGARSVPEFKPDWSPALADSGLFPGQLSFVPQVRILALGSFRPDYALVPWFDLLLRLGDRLRPEQVAHLPLVCHHARASVPQEAAAADPIVEQTRRALADAAQRRGWSAEPFLPETAHQRHRSFHQLRWAAQNLARLPVTIVIPTRDRLHLLQECMERLDETVDWRHAKLVIIDDHSRDADAVAYLAAIPQRPDLQCTVVRPADRSAPFNYSHLVNLALPHIDTPLVLHLNNDVNALERGWLEEMTAWFTQPDVGVVGAKLIYPDRTLNHTGIIIGPHGGLADTPFAKTDELTVGVEWHAAAREVSAVTGACLMTRTALYRALGGFDEKDFGVAYNDVDYCLRVRAAGHRIIYTPQAKLMHWGSATRGVTFNEAEHIAFVRRYPAYRDPYCSPHLVLVEGKLAGRGATAARPERAGRLRVLLLTHNLNLEGAPLFLLDYATYLARDAGFGLEILTAHDGPLRPAFEALGAHITVIKVSDIFGSKNEETFHSRVGDVAHQLDWEQIDLVMCNTLVSFWGVHLAVRAGKPSLFYIHESSSIFRFFESSLPLSLHHLVGQAFERTTRALFLCQATQAYYEDHNRHGNFRIVPSWIRLDVIEMFRRTHDRAALRRKHGIADDETVIANIGTVCERKGQHIFLRALEHFHREHGARGKFHFIMVGARPGIYLDLLQRDLARLDGPKVTLVPETPDVFDFFVAADLFVCTSYEESFPRVVMEAMAFRTPLVSTNVHGIAELVGQRQDGYLVPPGDHLALSTMMWTCLAKERSGKSLTPTAYSKVLRYYDYAKVLPGHVALAREAVLTFEEPPRARSGPAAESPPADSGQGPARPPNRRSLQRRLLPWAALAQPLWAGVAPYVRGVGWAVLFVLLAAAAFTLPFAPAPELDPSWRMALGYFFKQGAQFGREVVFTYGPLGFVMGKTYSGLQFGSLIAGQLFLALISAGTILLLGRRLSGLSSLLYFVYFLFIGVGYEDATHILIIAILGFELLRRAKTPHPWPIGLIGIVLAGYAQIKFTDLLLGFFIVLLTLGYYLREGRRREAVWLAVSYLVAFLGIWLACHQNLLNLPDYLYYSWQISEGYQWAMGFPTPSEPLWKALVILAVYATYGCYHLFTQPHRSRAVANTLLLCAFIFLQWKHGFTRPDGHMLGFFFCALLPLTAYPALLEDTGRLRRLHRWVFLGAMGLSLWGMENTIPGCVRYSVATVQAKVRANFQAAFHWAETTEHYRELLATARRQNSLPLVREIVGRATVDVLGYEQGVALFNDFNYQPRPVIQSYCTFMPSLVKLNGDFFASEKAPQFVLLKVESIDGRLPALDDARVLLLLAHRYQFLRWEKGYTLWKRTPDPFDPAAVEPKPLRTARLAINQVLPIEDLAAQQLWLKLNLPPSMLGQLRRFFYKLPQVRLSIEDTAGHEHDYVLPLPQGESGFIVNPLIENQEDYWRFAFNRPEKRARSLTLIIAPEDAKYFAPQAQVEISALPVSRIGANTVLELNEDKFPMFQTYPTDFYSHSGLSVERIDDRDAAILHSPSRVVFALPAGASTISGMFGFLPAAYLNGGSTDGAQFLIFWTDGTKRIDIYTKYLNPRFHPEDRGLQAFSVNVESYSGGHLHLEINPGPNNNASWDWAGWTNILIK